LVTKICIRVLLDLYGDKILNEIDVKKCNEETIKIIE
jgi:hypothetical protein